MIATYHRCLPALVSIAVLGCSNTPTAPEERTYDVAALQAGLDGLQSVFASESWVAFAAHTDRMTFPPPPAQPTTIVWESAPRRTPIIPSAYLGVTLGYDENFSMYTPDPLQTGAPPDGARFVLYDVNPQTGEPIVAAPQGFTDVRDIGAGLPDGFALAILAEFKGEQFADYTTSFSTGASNVSLQSTRSSLDHLGLDVSGTVASAQEAVNIDALAGQVDQVPLTELALGLADKTTTITGTIIGDPQLGDYSVSLALRDGESQLTLTGNGDATAFQGTAATGGEAFAAIAVTNSNITVAGENGTTVTSGEESLITALFRFATTLPATIDVLVIGVL